MGADSLSVAVAAAEYAGIELGPMQRAQLERFHDWLLEEAIGAGGIGPNEAARIWNRHIADSLLFALDLSGNERCIDLGSGVGLPGIPLAISLPEIEFTLVDRSGRRVDLARRACSVLGLSNCEVVQSDFDGFHRRFPRIVARASLPPAAMMIHVKRLLTPGGVAHLGLSRGTTFAAELPGAPRGLRLSIVEIPVEILDSGASLLRIEAS